MQYSRAFSGFSTDDLDEAKRFYGQTLGLEMAEDMGAVRLRLSGGQQVFIYLKPDHQPATYTVLNFMVADLEAAVAELRDKGVSFERYPSVNPDTDIAYGRAAGRGPDIAWFKDPAGNILALIADLEAAGNGV